MRQKLEVRFEQRIAEDANYRTTLLAQTKDLKVAIDCQPELNYHRQVKEFAAYLAMRREYAEFYLAVPNGANLPAGMLQDIASDGVGLILISPNGQLNFYRRSKNHALVVRTDPRLRFGKCKAEVLEAVEKFNNPEMNRKDGLRDLCDIGERETENIALLAVRKGYLKLSEKDVRDKDWNGLIDTLASLNAYHQGKAVLFDQILKNDMHSFRNARNLLNHPARNKREKEKLQRQFAEKMMLGARMVAEVNTIANRIR